uniref:V-myc myelocytomatosis viral oncogene homolog 1, lung carcinoma derived (Avian) a n=1 Tax=Iconisemion striatum TaxID=60296 RepID=A0A1A7YNZ3_9TELE
MEFDCYQPYFFDALDMEEDFYKSTAPSEDIWKKFELLPTPPMSPHRTMQLSPGDKLSWLSMVLGQDEDWGAQFLSDAEDHRAHIIQDCICRKPASSGSESRSDSSDDEEEIDVVTVESKQNRMRLVRKPVTLTVRADPCPKRFHVSVHRQQHNYAARSPESDPEPDEDDDEEEEDDDDYEEEPHSKRTCAASYLQPASPSDSSQNSDVEDTDRRRNHNFLERKRRNDLRSRFLALRDQIPGLESAKAPKVAILTQATEYLVELHIREKRQLQEKKRLKSRQQQLLRRLTELKC